MEAAFGAGLGQDFLFLVQFIDLVEALAAARADAQEPRDSDRRIAHGQPDR